MTYPIQNQNGVAMMMAMVTMVILGLLAGELVYEASVYNGIVFKQTDQLRAKLLAKSGLRLAMLQLRATEKAKAKVKALGLGEDNSLTDQIWKTPLILPPPKLPGLGLIESDALSKFSKSLGFEGSVGISISGESSRLPLNQLVWAKTPTSGNSSNPTDAQTPAGSSPAPINSQISPEKQKEILDQTKKSYIEILDQVLEAKRQSDSDFRDKYTGVTAQTLVGNILAWMDPNTKEDGDNRAKEEYYSSVEPDRYHLKNAPFISESEFFMIKGVDDTLAKILADTFSVIPSSSINVNEASLSLLRGLLPELGPDDVERIDARRRNEKEGGPFTNADDFWKFLATFGDFGEAKKRLEKQGFKILEPETSYRVLISAKSGYANKTWVANVGPLPPKTADPNTPNSPASQPTAPKAGQDLSKSFEENINEAEKAKEEEKKKPSNDTEALHILYLRADP